MKRLSLLLFMLLLMALIIVGCGGNAAEQAAAEQAAAEQAAAEQVAAEQAAAEQVALKAVKEFREEIYKIRSERLRSGISVSLIDMKFILKDLEYLADSFEIIDISKEWELYEYYNHMHVEGLLSTIRLWNDSEIFHDAEESEAIAELGAALGDDSLKILQTLTVAEVRNWLKNDIDKFLEVKIPGQ